MATTDEHVVQTTLDSDEYEQVREQAEKEGVRVEELLQRALRAYLVHRKYVPHDDPIFEVMNDLDPSVGEPTDARNMDEYVYCELWDDSDGSDEKRDREGQQERLDGGSILDVVDDLDGSVGDRTRAENMDADLYGEYRSGEGDGRE